MHIQQSCAPTSQEGRQPSAQQIHHTFWLGLTCFFFWSQSTRCHQHSAHTQHNQTHSPLQKHQDAWKKTLILGTKLCERAYSSWKRKQGGIRGVNTTRTQIFTADPEHGAYGCPEVPVTKVVTSLPQIR